MDHQIRKSKNECFMYILFEKIVLSNDRKVKQKSIQEKLNERYEILWIGSKNDGF